MVKEKGRQILGARVYVDEGKREAAPGPGVNHTRASPTGQGTPGPPRSPHFTLQWRPAQRSPGTLPGGDGGSDGPS